MRKMRRVADCRGSPARACRGRGRPGGGPENERMQVPPKEHPMWKALVLGQKKAEISFLAAKIMMARLRLAVQSNPASATAGAAELWAIYNSNVQMAAV